MEGTLTENVIFVVKKVQKYKEFVETHLKDKIENKKNGKA